MNLADMGLKNAKRGWLPLGNQPLEFPVKHLPYFDFAVGGAAAPQIHVSLRVSRSVMTHRTVPGGLCKLAVPDGGELPAESLISTLRSAVLCSSVNVSPNFLTVATPVKMVPLQHQR